MAKKPVRQPLGNRHSELTREKIKTAALINMLSEHVEGRRELTQTQVRSAEILLRKSLPDLSAIDTTVSGGEEPLVIQIVRLGRDPAAA